MRFLLTRNGALIAIAGVLILVGILLMRSTPLGASLLLINPGAQPPAAGFYVSRGYEAQPNERGSVVIQTAEALTDFSGGDFTFSVDPTLAEILRVSRTAVTQNFDISIAFQSPGVAHVTLVGAPKNVAQGGHLLEVELDLAPGDVLRTGRRIELALLQARGYEASGRAITLVHNGLITIVTNQEALELPLIPAITDVDPGVYPLVRGGQMLIRGHALPASARVILGSRSIPILSASSTEILALIPEDMEQGVYSVSVESLLAEERVVVFGALSSAGSVDILDALLFLNPNPILYSPADESGETTLWVPVFNPLGANDPVVGSADFSSIGGDPNVTFEGTGTETIGPGGETINWFQVPSSGPVSLAEGLETNVDYPIPVRVENRSGSIDTAIALLKLRSQLPQGDAPSFGDIETVPAHPMPGEDVTFYADVSDADGVESLQIVTIRLTPVGGSIQTMDPAIDPTALTTIPYVADFTLPASVVPGTYQLELRAVDTDANETIHLFDFIVSPPGGTARGEPPQFVGRLEARPDTAAPGALVDVFAGVRDPDGTATVDIVTIDLIDVGGGILELSPTIMSNTVGTLPVTYQASFDLSSRVADGVYLLPLRAVDRNGLFAETTVALTVDSAIGSGGGEGSAPEFTGRLETKPSPVGLGGTVEFFIAVRDTDGSDTIEKVSVDLVDIGGTELELESVSDAVSGSVEPVLYTGEYDLPSDIVPGVYSLAVRAFDNDGNAARTTITLMVSATGPQTSVPVILSAQAIPAQVPADDDTPVRFIVEIEDADGVEEDISAVSVNLTPLKLGIESLSLKGDVTAPGSTRGFFESDDIYIPTTVQSAGYDLQITVEDTQANRIQTLVRLMVGTNIGGDAPVIRESRFVPETARPGGDVRLYVEIEDANGAEDSQLTVMADFTEVEREVEELSDLIDFPSGTLVTRTTYASSTQSLPRDLSVGVYDIPLMVADDTGNIVRTIARLRVERGGADEGQEPRIDTTQVFQVPRVLPNDGSDNGELSVLVHDPDDDVITVIAKLGSVGDAVSASAFDLETDIEPLCRTSSTIVCLERGAMEDTGSRWFVLHGIRIPPTTQESTDPYMIELTAVDAEGHTAEAEVPLLIGGEDVVEELTREPIFNLVVPVSTTQLELVLSSPVDLRTVDRTGKQLVIRPALDAFSSLAVRKVSWDTTGRYLYLETDPLTPGETYILTVRRSSEIDVSPLTDANGNRFTPDRGGRITFAFDAPTGSAPSIDRVKVLDAEYMDVIFAEPVLPSSVHEDLLIARASIVSTMTGESRAVRDGVLMENGTRLRLRVDPLQEGDRYRLRIAGVLAPGLVEASVEKIFIALFPRHGAAGEMPTIMPTADLNRDGRIDFSDFALFSSVYNTEYDLQDIQDLSSGSSSENQGESSTFQFGQTGDPAGDGGTFGGDTPDLRF